MKIMILAALAALLAAPMPGWGAEANNEGLPPGCKALIADARACIPKGTPEDVRLRINHVLDMMADNIRTAAPAERPELCQATLMSYRQMADLVCTP
jgi:hypothetical protein